MAKAAIADRLDQITRELPGLITSISATELRSSVAVTGGLATVPEFHPNIIRLEALGHLCVLHARGTQTPGEEELRDWLNRELGNALLCRMEDPVEDVFVSNIITGGGNRRIFAGIWETPDLWLQDLIDVLATAPRNANFNRLRAEVDALLKLSEAIATRSNLRRFAVSGGEPYSALDITAVGNLQTIADRVTFTPADLQRLGISLNLLAPFIFDMNRRRDLEAQALGASELQRQPLIQFGGDLVVALPAAISTCLRMHILSQVDKFGDVRPFSARLLQRQTHKLFNEALRLSGTLGDLSSTLPPSGIDSKRMSQVAVAFDTGMIAHIVLLHDDIDEVIEEGLASYKQPPRAFQEKFSRFLENAAKKLGSDEDFVGGLTLVVMGGVGRGFAMLLPRMHDDWHLTVWSLQDVYGLAWLEQQWLLTLMKLMNQTAGVGSRGVELENNAGDVNVYSYWRAQEYRLIPRNFPIAEKHANISFSPGHVATFRQSFRQSFDTHAAYRPDERTWITVQKKIPKGHFKEVESQPVYASPDDAAHGLLRGVVETEQRSWWLDGGSRAAEEWQRDTQYRIWDAAINWLARLAPELERRITNLPLGSIIVQIDFSDPELWQHREDLTQLRGSPVEVSTATDPPRVTVTLHEAIFAWMQRPVNDGEKALVRAITEGTLRLSGVADAAGVSDEIVAAVVTSPDARWMHLFPYPQTVRDELAHFEQMTGRTIQEPDQRFATLSLAWTVHAPAAERREISEERHASSFLNQLVDVLWDRVRALLTRFDRRTVIEACLRNHEALILDRELWRRTARALVAVHHDRQDIQAASARHEGDLNRGTLASRVLAEMAASTCPLKGGKQLGTSNFDQLLAHVAWIIGIAYDSDALHSGLTDPTVLFFPNGEFSVSEGFYETIVAPYQNGYFAERFEENIKEYTSLYEEAPPRGRQVEEAFEHDFITAFEDEYEVTLQDLLRADEALQQYAVDHRRIVVDLSVAELSEVLRNAGLTAQHVDAFLRQFCLAPRERWDKAPAGFEPKDWYPWRFRRRLSLMARPVVLVGAGTNDRALFAPGLVHDAFANVVGGSHLGHFDTEYFHSGTMQRWIGAVNDRRGHAFNERVAEELRSIGYQARPSVDMARFHVPPEMGNLGDVDVLAWRLDGLVHPIECKNLRFARTIGEIVDQLNRFKGESNDELAKHLRRCDWLRSKVDDIAALIGLDPERITIKPLMITNTIVPMQFATGLPLRAEEIIPINSISARLR